MNRAAVEAEIDFYIKTNGDREITGPVLNAILKLLSGNYVSIESDLALLGLQEHNPAFTYAAGTGVIKSGIIYQANVGNTGTFDPAKWTARSTGVASTPPFEFTFTTDGAAQEFSGAHTFNNANLNVTVSLDLGGGILQTIAPVCEFTTTTWKVKFFSVPATGQVYKGCLIGIKL